MVSIPVDDKLAKELEALAKKVGRPLEDVAGDAVRKYLEREQYLAAIDEGIHAADAGDLIDGDVVDADLAKW